MGWIWLLHTQISIVSPYLSSEEVKVLGRGAGVNHLHINVITIHLYLTAITHLQSTNLQMQYLIGQMNKLTAELNFLKYTGF